jgi:hypothetical protein
MAVSLAGVAVLRLGFVFELVDGFRLGFGCRPTCDMLSSGLMSSSETESYSRMCFDDELARFNRLLLLLDDALPKPASSSGSVVA